MAIIKRVTMICLAMLFYCQGFGRIEAPVELAGFKKLTGYKVMMQYLTNLSKKEKRISLKIIGKSVQGRDIPALFISNDRRFGSKRDEKPVVMIFCQQHGNEPSGKEAAQLIARDLVKKYRSILEYLDLVLIPQVNPDGSEAMKRRNASGADLNRNHVILSEPEVIALHRVFNEWQPEVVLDVHEYNAISRRWDLSKMPQKCWAA
jgi:murein tripeptide amidase MpaA